MRTLDSGPLRDLDLAIESLRYHFQAIVSVRQGRTVGYEALARPLPCGAPCEPHAFVARAHRSGRSRALASVLCRAAEGTMARLPAPTRLWLNVTRRDLEEGTVLALVPHSARIVLELSEVDCPYAARAAVDAHRKLGFRIALDDFGAGCTALSALATLHPDIIKLDRSLVRGVDGESLRREAIRALLRLGERSGIEVVCEGVERASERDALLDLGADLMQGFLLGAPRPDRERRIRGGPSR